MEMKRIKGLISLTLFQVLLTTGVEAAQVPTAAGGSSQLSTIISAAGEFERLSPGDQKIARALFEAQYAGDTSVNTKPLTLDAIAAMKLRGEGWGGIFQQMRTEGRLEEKNLGQVVSEFASRHRASLSSPRASLGADERMEIAGDEERAQGSASFEGGSREKGLRLDSQTSVGVEGMHGGLGVRGGLGLGGGRRR